MFRIRMVARAHVIHIKISAPAHAAVDGKVERIAGAEHHV
jgi:hypothetical protein